EATHKPVAVEPEKQTDNTVKITGVIAGILLFVIIFLGVILLLKKSTAVLSALSAQNETKIDCVRVATKGEATHKPVAVEPEKQTDNTVKITGVIAGILLFVIIFLGVILLLKKRRTYHSYTYYLKLAKKRKETLSSTRQEMTVMVNSMDKSYTEQGTNCDEALSFMDTHSQTLNTRSECTLTLNGRSECTLAVNGRTVLSPSSFTLNKSNNLSSTLPKSYYPDPFVPTAILDDSQTLGGGGGSCSDTSSLVQSHGHSLRKREGTVDAPYQTGQLHPAIRVADLLQHITQMKCAEGYGFKEEYECPSVCSACLPSAPSVCSACLPSAPRCALSVYLVPPRCAMPVFLVPTRVLCLST
ncbi:receptor-type tyrosine-protein phosphatase mu-like, partial [Oncorhynchus masou masou]|uniref:receptor-type tyrosine-protein phosphatase mu-like n=1 Tax=Oncorhynchus masou masou TaxID=90313 RepID=UPI0031840BA9